METAAKNLGRRQILIQFAFGREDVAGVEAARRRGLSDDLRIAGSANQLARPSLARALSSSGMEVGRNQTIVASLRIQFSSINSSIAPLAPFITYIPLPRHASSL